MPSKKKIATAEKCERCKRQKAEFIVTELVVSKLHKPVPYRACRACASRAQKIAGKMITRL